MLLQSPTDSRKDDVELSHIPKVKDDLLHLGLTLWLCSDSCHTCDVPGQK